MAEEAKEAVKTGEKKSSRLMDWLGIGIIATVALLLIDQGRVMKRIFEPLLRIAGLSLDAAYRVIKESAATVDDEVRHAWSYLKKWTWHMLLIAAVLFAIGIKFSGHHDGYRLFIIAGGIMLVGIACLWILTIRLTLYLALLGVAAADKIAGGILRKFRFDSFSLDAVEEGLKTQSEKLKSLDIVVVGAMAFTAFALLFPTPAGLITTFIGIFLAATIMLVGGRAGWVPKKGYEAVALFLILAVVVIAAKFLVGYIFPETKGSWSLRPIGQWLANPFAYEFDLSPIAKVVLIVLVPVALFIIGAFASKERKASWNAIGRLATPLAIAAILWLAWTGRLRDNDAAVAVTGETQTSTTTIVTSPGPTAYPTTTLTPPFSGTTPPASRPRVIIKVPPPEPPKEYTNLTQGLDDLEALGY